MCSPFLDWFKASWLVGPYPVVVDASSGGERLCPAPTLYNAARDLAGQLAAAGVGEGHVTLTSLPPSIAWLTLWLASRRLGAWMVVDALSAATPREPAPFPAVHVGAAQPSDVGGFELAPATWPRRLAPPPAAPGGGLAWLRRDGRLLVVDEGRVMSQLGPAEQPRAPSYRVQTRWRCVDDLGDVVAALRGPEELHLPPAA